MDWYFVPAVVIAVITTIYLVIMLAFTLSVPPGTSGREEMSRITLMVLGGYVIALIWPLAIPAIVVVTVSIGVRDAFNDRKGI